MEIKKETKWLCENAHALEKYSGKWVMFNVMQGFVKKDQSLTRLLRFAGKISTANRPFVLHVPSKRELEAPLPGSRRK